MNIRIMTGAAACAAALALAACGGGGSGASAPRGPSSGGQPASGTAGPAQAFQITIPATTAPTASVRRPQYVSPNTGSISIVMQSSNGQAATGTPTIAKVASGAPGCTTVAGNLVCVVNAAAVVGVDVFAVATYASADGSGPVLASTTVAQSVTPSSATTPVPLALGGVPATIAFSPAALPLVNGIGIQRFPVTLNALDASGATIVGAQAYQSPVSLQIMNDPTHALSLSTASVTQPGTVVTVTFDGSKQLAHATIHGQAGSTGSATLIAAPLNVTPVPLIVFDDQPAGVPATVSQAGFTGNFSAAVSNPTDATATVAVGPLQSGSAIVTIVPHTTFDVTTVNIGNGIFSVGVPLAVVPHNGNYTAFGRAHQLIVPANMVKGPDGKFWTGDAFTGAIVSFDPTTGVYASTVVDTTNQSTGPTALAFDGAGNIWYGDGAQIGEFTPGQSTATTFSTGLLPNANITAIIAGPSGTMWFYDQGQNSTGQPHGLPSAFGTIDTTTGQIAEYPTPNGAAPSVGAMSMIVGPDNAIWFADGFNQRVGRIDPASPSSIAEYTVSSPNFPTQSPLRLAVGPDNNIWFASVDGASGEALVGTISMDSTRTVSSYPVPQPGIIRTLIAGSDGHLWFTASSVLGTASTGQDVIGVINPVTHAAYEYSAVFPQFSVITGLIDRGDRTLWMLDTSNGQIGKVPFQ